VSPNPNRLLDHEYDGIEEYDNPLPGWWTWLFVATIVFSVGYWLYYQIGPGPTIIAEYEADVRASAERTAKSAPAASADESAMRALMKDARAMAAAKETFATRCAACHGPEGQGLVGPNLTDDYWIHGRTLTDIRRTIDVGVPDKGMVPWKDQLKPEDIAAVTAYIATLAGSHPPNPKPPQGVNAKGEAAPAAPTASN
jgi:cytochrome c oxidase cbb3-type subunit 3